MRDVEDYPKQDNPLTVAEIVRRLDAEGITHDGLVMHERWTKHLGADGHGIAANEVSVMGPKPLRREVHAVLWDGSDSERETCSVAPYPEVDLWYRRNFR